MLSAEAYVARLGHGPTRAAIGVTALLLTLLGGALYGPFTARLIVSVEPTPDSPSGIARAVYSRYFPPDPVQLIVLMKSKSGGPIAKLAGSLDINTSRPIEKWVSFNASTALTAKAAAISHAMKRIVTDSLLLKCRFSFMSYFDVGLPRSHAGTHDRPVHDLLDDVIQERDEPPHPPQLRANPPHRLPPFVRRSTATLERARLRDHSHPTPPVASRLQLRNSPHRLPL